MGGNLAGWSHKGYMPKIATEYGNDPRRVPFDFPEVLAAIAPRSVFINAPLHDSNFEISGVRDCLHGANQVYRLLGSKKLLGGSEDRLVAEHPDCGHEFPIDVRRRAYRFIDDVLRPLD
jgi:hypothetical protein